MGRLSGNNLFCIVSWTNYVRNNVRFRIWEELSTFTNPDLSVLASYANISSQILYEEIQRILQ
jgi:hypothetical protein